MDSQNAQEASEAYGPKAEARDKEAWCPWAWLSLRPCCIWIPHADYAQAEAQDQRCTWVKEKVSSKFELRSCSQIVATEPLCDCGYFNSSNFGHIVLPVLKVLTLALDSSCRSFFFV